MKTHWKESLNPRYQEEHFESKQAILASLTQFRFFKVVISGVRGADDGECQQK